VDVQVTILAHEAVDTGTGELHRFVFAMSDGLNPNPIRNSISLRTARALVGDIIAATAFGQMIIAIADADPADYDALVGKTFKHL
jgi:hypothetical protein